MQLSIPHPFSSPQTAHPIVSQTPQASTFSIQVSRTFSHPVITSFSQVARKFVSQRNDLDYPTVPVSHYLTSARLHQHITIMPSSLGASSSNDGTTTPIAAMTNTPTLSEEQLLAALKSYPLSAALKQLISTKATEFEQTPHPHLKQRRSPPTPPSLYCDLRPPQLSL